jgi:hypothetical protein
VTDIITLIDEATATVCGWCQARLMPDGPSEYYCDDECQFEWQRLRGEALVGYQEPVDLDVHYMNEPAFPDVPAAAGLVQFLPVRVVARGPSPDVLLIDDDSSLLSLWQVWQNYITDRLILYGFERITAAAADTARACSAFSALWTSPPDPPGATQQQEQMPDLPAVTADGLFAYTDDGGTTVLTPQMPELPPPEVRVGHVAAAAQTRYRQVPRTIHPRGCS